MFKVGDLVKRVRVLQNSTKTESFEWVLSDAYKDDIGIVLEVEAPYHGEKIFNLSYPECFVKVKWQKRHINSPIWHWGEELGAINIEKK